MNTTTRPEAIAGAVVVSKDPSGRHEIGDSSVGWNMTCFEPFYGEITITSEPD